MPTYTAETITLQSRPFEEAARLLHLYSRRRGRIEAIARGIGKPRSKLTPCTQTFSHCDLMLAEGKSLHTVTQCQTLETFASLRTDVRRLAYASYLAELVQKSTAPLAPNAGLFELLLTAVGELAAETDAELLARAFEVRWLGLIGLAPSLEVCASCGEALPAHTDSSPGGGLYSAAAGGAVCRACAHLGPVISVCAGTLRALKLLASADLDVVQRLRLDDRIRLELRRALRRHVDYHLDLRLNSLKFLRSLEEAPAPAADEQGAPSEVAKP